MKLPIGKSNFKSLREDNCYYVDKTREIIEFFNLSGDIILMPRPRRFGKTLFLSTLYYFFNNLEQNEKLFANTYIYGTDFFKQHAGRYPVIFLTFKDVRGNSYERMLTGIKQIVNTLYYFYEEKIDIDKISYCKEEKQTFLRIVNRKADINDYENSIKHLSILLRNYYEREVIILIDEYDTPIITGYLKGYYDDAIEFFRNLFGAAFKDNDVNVKKALITGILRISGESMFSGLNNVDNLTILVNEMSTACGFTEDEVKQLLSDCGYQGEAIDKAIKTYNGYIFGDNTTIFNPWSIINYADKGQWKPYWANTSSNDLIKDLIKKSRDFRDELDRILRGEPVDVRVNENLTFKDSELYQKDNIFSFLFFSGYLKCKEKYYKRIKDRDYLYCKMIPTNVECEMIFDDIISSYVKERFYNQELEKVLKSLVRGDLKEFEKRFSYLLRDTLSYHDIGVEGAYHTFLLGLLLNLSDYEILSNPESGYGRVDVMILHKEDKTKPAIVIELKKIDEFEEETKDKALENAVKQIKEKEYMALARKRGYENIIAFGLVFDGKRCWIREALFAGELIHYRHRRGG